MKNSLERLVRRIAIVCVSLALACPSVACGQSAPSAAELTRPSQPQSDELQNDKQRLLTLQSVVRLDDHPLYFMKYFGGYDADVAAETSEIPTTQGKWACSLFAALGSKERPLFGRNFDWYDNPALVLLTDTPDAYASISMVDVSYLGFESQDKKFDSVDGREELLKAPLIPFDGMNEHGLTVGMAAVDGAELPNHPDKPTVGSLRIIRLVLDQCRTVAEGIELFEQYNIDFSGGPQIHYLLADADGNSALVELSGGKMHILRNETTWHAATNFYLKDNRDRASAMCGRYAQIKKCLENHQGALDEAQAFGLLDDVAQESTRWSVVYDLKAATASIVMSRRFDHPIRLSLAEEKPVE